jgi:hypothetical protein
MPATASDIISRSARRIGLLANEETLSSAEVTNALQGLNDMLFGFGPAGIAYVHSTLGLTDTLNVPDEQVRNVMLMFCKDLADDYTLALSQSLLTDIFNARNELQAAYLVINPAVPDRALRRRRAGWIDFERA